MENELRELLEAVRREERDSFECLAERYRSLTEAAVHRFAPSFGISGDSGTSGNGYGLDDLRQFAAMALYRAALSYRPDAEGRKVSFGLYAKICINNAMISEFRKFRRRNKKSVPEGKTKTGKRGKDSRASGDPLYRIGSSEEMRGVLESFRSGLSAYEREVFECYIVGKSVKEIAERLGKSEKSVSNALYRMKVKIRGLLKN